MQSTNPTCTASATGNPRNKVALKPGRSLMDWIRLTNSTTDLSGNGGRGLRDVTPEELARHSSRQDAWLAIRGLVYNVTAYFEYHPGGEDELMKGIGIDATNLFDEVHKWVNYESMLKKCLVGRLKGDGLPTGSRKRPESKTSAGFSAPSLPSLAPSITTGVTTDWMQSPSKVTLVFFTRQKGLDARNVSTALDDTQLRVRIINGERKCYEYRVRPTGRLDPASRSLTVSSSTGKVELSFAKVRPDVHWPSIGQVEAGEVFRSPAASSVSFHTATLGSKTQLNHNVYLYEVKLPPGLEFYVPIGWHVHLKLFLNDGSEVTRSYTPVTRNLMVETTDSPSRIESVLTLHFLIKVYPSGPFTSQLHQLSEGSPIQVSDPTGSFEGAKLFGKEQQLVCIAAGTGITPMIRPILDALNAHRMVSLLFFNRTRGDIILEEAFRQLQLANPETFHLWHVLSEPDDEWTGLRGRINSTILAKTIQSKDQDSPGSRFICVCGPTDFNLETLRLLDDGGFKSDEIHCFSG